LSEYLSQHQQLTADGRIAVVRNGYLPKLEIQTGIDSFSVLIPRIRTRVSLALTSPSALVPPYDRKTRFMKVALPLELKNSYFNVPKLTIVDGTKEFWAAMEETIPHTHQQRCWVHKTANILNSLPKTPHSSKQKLPYMKSGRQRLKQYRESR
jgi:hypothetical protein